MENTSKDRVGELEAKIIALENRIGQLEAEIVQLKAEIEVSSSFTPPSTPTPFTTAPADLLLPDSSYTEDPLNTPQPQSNHIQSTVQPTPGGNHHYGGISGEGTEQKREGYQHSGSSSHGYTNSGSGSHDQTNQQSFNLFEMLFNRNPIADAVGGLGGGIQDVMNAFLSNHNLLETLESGCTTCRTVERSAREMADQFGKLASNLETSLVLVNTLRSFTDRSEQNKDASQLLNLISTFLPMLMNLSNNPLGGTAQGKGSPGGSSSFTESTPFTRNYPIDPFYEDD